MARGWRTGAGRREGWWRLLAEAPWWVLAAFALLVVGVCTYPKLTFDNAGAIDDVPTLDRLSSLAISLAWVAVGLLYRARAPRAPIWALLVLVGLAWAAEDLVKSDNEVLRLGLIIGKASSTPALIWLALAYPSGRLERLRDLVVVAISAAAALALGIFWTIAALPKSAVHHPASASLSDGIQDTVSAVTAVCVAATVLTMVERWRASSRPARRVRSPVLLTGIVMATLMLVDLVIGAATWANVPPTAFTSVERALLLALPFAFLAGLLRLELSRVAVSQGVLALGPSPDLRGLRSVLAEALADPAVRVLEADRGSLLDEEGKPAPPDAGGLELRDGGEEVGRLVVDSALRQDERLLGAVRDVAAAAVAAHGARRRLEQAVHSERGRIERDLHDGAQQRLSAALVWLEVLERRLDRLDAPTEAEIARRLTTELGEALEELRELTRGSQPSLLVERGLDGAIAALAARSPIPVRQHGTTGERLSLGIEAAVYFAVAEALANAVKHSGAEMIDVILHRSPEALMVTVGDDGRGGADPRAGSGLQGLRDRLAAHGGTVAVDSSVGRGTTVRIDVPLPAGVGAPVSG